MWRLKFVIIQLTLIIMSRNITPSLAGNSSLDIHRIQEIKDEVFQRVIIPEDDMFSLDIKLQMVDFLVDVTINQVEEKVRQSRQDDDGDSDAGGGTDGDDERVYNGVRRILQNVFSGNLIGVIQESVSIRSPPVVQTFFSDVLSALFGSEAVKGVGTAGLNQTQQLLNATINPQQQQQIQNQQQFQNYPGGNQNPVAAGYPNGGSVPGVPVPVVANPNYNQNPVGGAYPNAGPVVPGVVSNNYQNGQNPSSIYPPVNNAVVPGGNYNGGAVNNANSIANTFNAISGNNNVAAQPNSGNYNSNYNLNKQVAGAVGVQQPGNVGVLPQQGPISSNSNLVQPVPVQSVNNNLAFQYQGQNSKLNANKNDNENDVDNSDVEDEDDEENDLYSHYNF